MGIPGGPSGMVVLAVDDDELALEELSRQLRAHAAVATVLTASDAGAALRVLRGHREPTPDAVFLDVAMPGLDGLETARVLARLGDTPSVVFVTAADDRAVEAFEVGAVDYLLEPVRPARVWAAVDRVVLARARAAARAAAERTAPPDEIVPVELAGCTTLVPRSEVHFVEAHGDYARLYTDAGHHLVRIPLAVLEQRWRESGWTRVHRSYLVSLDRVTALEPGGSGHVVRLGRGRDAVELPVSRRHLRDVRARLRERQAPATGAAERAATDPDGARTPNSMSLVTSPRSISTRSLT